MKRTILALALVAAGCTQQISIVTTPKELTKLDLAAQSCDYYEIERMTRGKKNDASDLNTALVMAVREGQNDIAELLIRRGADIQAEGDYEGPLDAAAGTGNLSMVQMLLKKGAEVNRTGAAAPAVVRAAEIGNLDVLKYLIAHGGDINSTDPMNGDTALHTAARTGQSDLVDFLIHDPKIQVNRIAWQGTALDEAIDAGARAELIEKLKTNGAVQLADITTDSNFDKKQFLLDHPDPNKASGS